MRIGNKTMEPNKTDQRQSEFTFLSRQCQKGFRNAAIPRQ